MTILITEKEDLRTRNITRDKEGEFHNDTKKSLLKRITVLNVCSPTDTAS